MTNLNRKQIMTKAWAIKNNLKCTMSAAMTKAWASYKTDNASVLNLSSKRVVIAKTDENYEVTITDFDFAYTLKKIKNFDERKYNAEKRVWLVPVNNSRQLLSFLKDY